jgi:XTP/dITP diphosphohydrolase/ATP diphosphatase
MNPIHPVETEEAQTSTAQALQRAAAIMARLRAPDGCPWDREQTFDTIRRHTLEETYEVFDAIERRAWSDLKDELGDLLLQVLFYAQMGSELPVDGGRFDLREVAENLSAKLIRRHPHVFGDAIATGPDAVLRNWERIKIEEKKAMPALTSLLDDIPRTMPATLEAFKLSSRAAKVGFDWPSADGLFDKLAEETAELRAEIDRADSDKIEVEFGDLLFTMMNLARHLHLDAESALRRSNAKFRIRFAAMERSNGGTEQLKEMSSEELDRLWSKAKLETSQQAQPKALHAEMRD